MTTSNPPGPIGPASPLIGPFACAPVAFQLLSLAGDSLYVNPAWLALFGSPPQAGSDVLQDSVATFPALRRHFERAVAGETVKVRVWWTEVAAPRRGPQDAPRRLAIERTFFPLSETGGATTHVGCIFQDVTEHARTSEALRKTAGTLRQAMSLGRLVAFETDYRTGNTVFSANADALLGLRPGEAVGDERLQQLIHGDDRQGLLEASARARDENGPLELRFRQLHPDTGAIVHLELRAEQLRLPTGEAVGNQGVLVDVSAQHELEESQLRSERFRAECERAELRQHTAALEQEKMRMEQARRIKRSFVTDMSHELRTPLNAILGFSELLYDGVVDRNSTEAREFLGDILSSGRHLLELINDMLDLARIDAGKLEFHPEHVQLAALVEEVRASLHVLLESKRLALEVRVDEALADVTLDPVRFKQVVYNYLSNAIKFTPEGGRILTRVSARDPETSALEVEDSGIGIAAQDLERLFLEFSQLSAGLSKGHPGAGLGLALTRHVVEAQGGSVAVRSEVGKGSVFSAVLPRRPAQVDGATRPRTGAPASTRA